MPEPFYYLPARMNCAACIISFSSKESQKCQKELSAQLNGSIAARVTDSWSNQVGRMSSCTTPQSNQTAIATFRKAKKWSSPPKKAPKVCRLSKSLRYRTNCRRNYSKSPTDPVGLYFFPS